MKITYNGTPGEGHNLIHMYGQDFPRGKAVTVTSPLAIRKLANHPHFSATEEASDNVEDAKIKREFTGAAEAALAPVEEAHVPPVPTPAPTPAPTEAPVVVPSAQAWQDRYEKAPVDTPAVFMPQVVKSAAEWQDLEQKGAVNGNSDAARDEGARETEDSRSDGKPQRGRPRKG